MLLHYQSKVTLILKGGLANQLIQYVAASIIADKRSSRLLINNILFSKGIQKISGVTERSFMLFWIKTKNIEGWPKSLITIIKAKLHLASNHNISTIPQAISSKSKNIILDGYFQDPILFDNTHKQYWLNIASSISLYNATSCNLYDSSKSLVVHVRKADYLRLTNIYHQISPAEYVEMMKTVINKNKCIQSIYFLTDSPLWLTSFLLPLIHKDHDLSSLSIFSPILNTEMSFRFLSVARYLVISNSTFSLVAAYLSYVSNHLIYLQQPSLWYSGCKNPFLSIFGNE